MCRIKPFLFNLVKGNHHVRKWERGSNPCTYAIPLFLCHKTPVRFLCVMALAAPQSLHILTLYHHNHDDPNGPDNPDDLDVSPMTLMTPMTPITPMTLMTPMTPMSLMTLMTMLTLMTLMTQMALMTQPSSQDVLWI